LPLESRVLALWGTSLWPGCTGAKTPDPVAVQKELHQIRGWQGVTGVHTFDDKGDVINKPIPLKVMRDGVFYPLETYFEKIKKEQ